MQKIIFISTTLLLLTSVAMSCLFKRKHKPAVASSIITVIGNAQNISGQAAVVTDSAGIYFIDGMNGWENDWLNHTVKITGDLARPGYEMKKTNEEGRSENTQKIIKAAVVMLLDNEPGMIIK